MIDGVEKLPPGHWLEWRDGRVSKIVTGAYRPWRPRAYRLRTRKGNSIVLLQQSVSEHMMSDVPLGVWVSGGDRLDYHSALCRAGFQLAAAHIFDFLSRPQLRRVGIHRRSGAAVWLRA